MADPIHITRTQAADLIDTLRVAAMHPDDTEAAFRVYKVFVDWCEKRNVPPFEPCTGLAHDNPHIDHCLQCAPHWGYLGPEVKVR